MRRYCLLFLVVLSLPCLTFAQPSVLGTQAANGSYTTYNLTAIGLFRQARVQASSSGAGSTRNWEFTLGSAASPDYSTNWRPYTAGQTLSAYNSFIDPASTTASARYNTGSGGQSGLMPAVSSGNYYTFNVGKNPSSNNYMSVLETTYNPTVINTISATTPLNTNNSVLVTITTSGVPNSGENFFVRYSTDFNFTTSTISQFTFTGTTATAIIPCFPGGTLVYYYAFSSNKTGAQLNTDAIINQSAYDMGTLNLKNNSGPNFTYTQGSGTNFIGIYTIPSPCFATLSSFITALNAGTITGPVTCYVIGGSPIETAPSGGIAVTATGTVANPVIIRKFGSGSYSIQASPALSSGNLNDAIIKLIGTDYFTIDGLTLQENASNTITAAGTNNMTEWGIALLHASTTDGAQNNTIQNNTISLNRTYTNTFGIYANNRHSAIAVTVTEDIVNNTTAPNSGNKIYSNSISNVNMGIAFIGSGTAADHDANNDIGGNAIATGNTISNWGTEAAVTTFVSNPGVAYGILVNHQVADNVSYNSLISPVVSINAPACTGILKDYTSSAPIGSYTSTVAYNTITGLSATGASAVLSGIKVNGGTIVNVNDNVINSINGSGTASPVANGILVSNGTTVNIFRNRINTISQTGVISASSPAVNGLLITDGTTVTACNNFVADLNATNASLPDAVRGISVTSSTTGSTYNLYYNSVYINAASGGANFGSTGIFHVTSTTATTAALNLTDNIVVNTSTPAGTGVTAAYRRSDPTLSNYASASDHNLFYAGTPSVGSLIYYDGTNSDQTLQAYKTRVGSRDAGSISVLPNFTSATDLHLTASNNCAIDGAGIPLGSVSTDIDSQPRDINTPDIGADEFTGVYGNTLAGVAGSAICDSKNISLSGTTFATNSCSLIARVLPSGSNAVSGNTNSCVTLDATQQFYNAEPYVQRHYDIEPASANTITTSATITLYFNDAEFVTFNSNNPGWPKLPTSAGGGNTDPNRANLKVTQYHGTPLTSPSRPGSYTGNSGAGVYIDPPDANIVWNGSYWSVTFDVTGFSGFYVHSNPKNPLPLSVDYFNGTRQGTVHQLNWKISCNSTPGVSITLERGGNAAGPFTAITTLTADALHCSQPFGYTDAQPMNGMNYYRLRIQDATGNIIYSNILPLLNAAKGFELVNIAPNPVHTNGRFRLNISSAGVSEPDLVISDMQGRMVDRQKILLVAGFNSIEINEARLAAGTYSIRVFTSENISKVIRFVKQ